MGRFRIKHPAARACQLAGLAGLLLMPGAAGLAQERWFLVEVSVFSNENPADRDGERWSAATPDLRYPPAMRRFDHLLDLLLSDELTVPPEGPTPAVPPELAPDGDNGPDPGLIRLRETGPFPFVADENFRFFDLARDPFVLLPDSFSDFQQSNRALVRSAEHRLLFAGRWRQPVLDPGRARPLYIEGGIDYGDFHELQGSITIRFNDGRDRVVIDTNLWLADVGLAAGGEEQWSMPAIPADLSYPGTAPAGGLLPDDTIRRIYPFMQSREMRSTEFHYLDHPALGLIIQVEPYELPPSPDPDVDPFTPAAC